jgi:nitric oxide reductase NorE protein
VTLEDQAADLELPEFLWPDAVDPPNAAARRASGATDGSSDHVPGEIGLWIFILGDMTLFGAMFIVLMWENRSARAAFHGSAQELAQSIGVVNTLVLLLSSYLVVAATWAHRRGDHVRATRYVLGALACALAFATLKGVEYSHAITAGHTPTTNLLFTFYFVLTGVHLLHVVVGSGLLVGWWLALRRRRPWIRGRRLFEGIAVYWHMVDLLWIAIFTLVYLACAS